MRKKSVLFIMGNPRSGSTLVTMIASSHSKAFGIGEAEGIRAALDHQKENKRQTVCLCCSSSCHVWDRPALSQYLKREAKGGLDKASSWRKILRPGFYTKIFEETGAEVLVDSSKRVDWLDLRRKTFRDWIQAQPKMLFVTRDGRGALNSWLRAYPERPLEDHIHRWLENMESTEAAYERFPDTHRMRIAYEDVAREPDKAARRICEFLNLKYEPGMSEYWKHDHHILRGNLGTLSLVAKGADGKENTKNSVPARQKFYRDLGKSIHPDEAWRSSLTSDQLEVFERLAGSANARYVA